LTHLLFKDKGIPTFQCSFNFLSIFEGINNIDKVQTTRQIGDIPIDKFVAWGFFNGARQGNPNLCGIGYLTGAHFSQLKVGLGDGSNICKTYGLELLLKCVFHNNIQNLQRMGDSMVVINWMKGLYRIDNLILTSIYDQLKLMEEVFNNLSYLHICRELNTNVGSLLKECI
jgi:hypothetical protein